MNDTSPQIAAQMEEMLQHKTAAERLALGCSMFDFSRQMVISSLLRQRPSLSRSDLRRELFQIFYGSEFDAKHRGRIMEYLA